MKMSIKRFSELQLLTRMDFRCEGPTLVDVGAHIGGFAKLFAELGWRVVAFEPEPNNYQRLRANLGNFPNVTCIAKAVSDASEERVAFYVSSDHWGIHSLQPFHPTHQSTVMVDTVRLDEVLDDLGVEKVTVLKIDVEGADFLALRSFDFDRYRPEAVMLEFMDERSLPNYGYTHHDMVAYMTAHQYVAFVSEWEPIEEYAREGVAHDPHTWVQCVRYPLHHAPAWGNLLFVPQSRVASFERTLRAYLREIELLNRVEALRPLLQAIPGARFIYQALRKANLSLGGE